MPNRRILLASCLGFLPLGAATAADPVLTPPIAGSGPGVHGANSPFAPLNDRADVVAWSTLTAVTTDTRKKRLLPVFTPQQLALNQRIQRVQGFMMPLDAGLKQTRFLLTSVPASCGFCVPGGPESMLEVRSRSGVRATLEPIVVEGRFHVLADDPSGLYYRMTDAALVG